MFPEPTELLLIGYSIESIWTTKIQIKYIDTKNQLADILTKGNFTLDEWNHLLCLFNISHFSSTDCAEVMSKRTQKDSGEERVTAKSKPMMNSVSRCSERTPDVLATSSESPGRTRYESQLSLSSWNEQHQRTRRLVEDAYSSSFSKMECWWSFLHRVNDRVRKMQVQSSKDATKDSNKHSLIWGMFMSSTLEASVLMGKNYLENLHSIKNTGKDLTMKQMFDISEKLMVE